MEDNIIHKYPKTKDKRFYTDRYNKEDFEKYKEITKSIENYEKWKIGINYKTKRKIKIEGKTHKQLGYENFYIKGNLFTKLDGVNIELYLQENEKIKKEIQDYNSQIQDYNSQIQDLICKINLLKKWDEYIIFEETKYGIPYVYDDIHMEHNCFGLIKHDHYESCNCNSCSIPEMRVEDNIYLNIIF